jgi:hypothetical protein
MKQRRRIKTYDWIVIAGAWVIEYRSTLKEARKLKAQWNRREGLYGISNAQIVNPYPTR